MKLTVTGIEELKGKFAQMSLEAQGHALDEAVLAGAQVIAAEARAHAPILSEHHADRIPGQLAASIDARLGRRKDNYTATATIGPRKSGGFDPWWAGFVEYGHRVIRRGIIAGKQIVNLKIKGDSSQPRGQRAIEGSVVGYAPAKPFLRRALQSRGPEAVAIIKDRLVQAVERAAAE